MPQWIKDPKVGEYLINTRTNRVVKVLEVSSKWGWARVMRLGSNIDTHLTINSEGIMFYRRLTDIERADMHLRLENAGVTDYWRD